MTYEELQLSTLISDELPTVTEEMSGVYMTDAFLASANEWGILVNIPMKNNTMMVKRRIIRITDMKAIAKKHNLKIVNSTCFVWDDITSICNQVHVLNL